MKGIGSLSKQHEHCPEGCGSHPNLLRSFCFCCSVESEWRKSVQTEAKETR